MIDFHGFDCACRPCRARRRVETHRARRRADAAQFTWRDYPVALLAALALALVLTALFVAFLLRGDLP